jgi:hypothetical protein
MNLEQISLTTSLLALTIALATFWLTRIKRGSVKMTKPTVIYFGPDGRDAPSSKIFIRTLLYSTSDKGQYIENMYIKLQRGESVQNFNIWVYRDRNDKLVRGSGLFVGKSGISSDNHFLLPKDGSSFDFKKGTYHLDIFVELTDRKPKHIHSQSLEIDSIQEDALKTKKAGIYFDWAPNTQSYHSHIDNKI